MKLIEEIQWVEHPVYKGYLGNKRGEIWSISSMRKLKGNINRGNYHKININSKSLGIQNKSVRVHIFIYECFRCLVDSSIFDIDHIDGNHLNNRLENLQKLTRKEHAKKTMKNVDGSKARNVLSKPVRRYKLKDGKRVEIEEYETLHKAAKEMSCYKQNIVAVIFGYRNRTRLGGYYWEYIVEENLPGEIWKTIDEERFKNVEFSNMGRVKTYFGAITYGTKLPTGYYKIQVNKIQYIVHRLICLAFHGLPLSDKHDSVDHLDKNRGNNRADNLRWATIYEQRNNSVSIPVVGYDKDGKRFGPYNSFHEAARKTKAHRGAIGHIINKTGAKRETSGGLKWIKLENDKNTTENERVKFGIKNGVKIMENFK